MSLTQNEERPRETTPLRRGYDDNGFTFKTEEKLTLAMFWEELQTLPRYAWPVLGLAPVFIL